jgi:GTPase SAR1 family protein
MSEAHPSKYEKSLKELNDYKPGAYRGVQLGLPPLPESIAVGLVGFAGAGKSALLNTLVTAAKNRDGGVTEAHVQGMHEKFASWKFDSSLSSWFGFFSHHRATPSSLSSFFHVTGSTGRHGTLQLTPYEFNKDILTIFDTKGFNELSVKRGGGIEQLLSLISGKPRFLQQYDKKKKKKKKKKKNNNNNKGTAITIISFLQ